MIDENGKPLTYWGGVDFTNPNANNIKSDPTQLHQQEISDEEIEKQAKITSGQFIDWSIYETSAFILGAKWMKEQLKQNL